MEIRLDEVVVGGVLGELPCAHGVGEERIADVEVEVSLLVDVDKDVAGLEAFVGLHVVLDRLGPERLIVRFCKHQNRAFGNILVHGEISALSELAGHRCAVVVDLTVGKAVDEHSEITFDYLFHRVYPCEINEVEELHVELESGVFGHGHGKVVRLRYGTADIDVARECSLLVESQIPLVGMGFRRNERAGIRVAVEGKECLATCGHALAERDRMVDTLAAVDFDVDRIIAVVDSPCRSVGFVADVCREGQHGDLLLYGIAHTDVDSSVDGLAVFGVAGDHVIARRRCKGIQHLVDIADRDILAGGLRFHRHGR